MSIFGKPKLELEKQILRLERETERLSRQNELLLIMFDAWITRIRMDYEGGYEGNYENEESKSDSGAQDMRWDYPNPRVVLEADRKLEEKLKKAGSRDQKVKIYAIEIPEIVRLILETSWFVPDLSEIEQVIYQNTMAKVRMYYYTSPNGTKYRDEVLIGTPMNWEFLEQIKQVKL